MSNRLVRSMGTLAIMMTVALALAPGRAAGQAASASAKAGSVAPPTYVPPRTPDGQPNISGMWQPGFAGQPEETPAGEPWRPPAGYRDPSGAYDFGAQKVTAALSAAEKLAISQERKPMVIDPPDGKIPLQPWAAAKRTEIIANPDKIQFIDPRVRCLQSGVPRVNLPVGYNSYQFLQKPGYVVLLYEWNHMTRVIPLDGRPHLSPKIRQANGDSRGHWEGNTLVVDVTNFSDDTWVVGHGAPPENAPASSLTSGHGIIHGPDLHVVERFTMLDADTIRYEATIEDPQVFTRPWTIALNAFKRGLKDHQLFEYACHEGNRGNIILQTGLDTEAK